MEEKIGGSMEGARRMKLAEDYKTTFESGLLSELQTRCTELGIRTWKDVGLTENKPISELFSLLKDNPQLALENNKGRDEKIPVLPLLIGAMVDAKILQERRLRS